jgi:hypothetical protein
MSRTQETPHGRRWFNSRWWMALGWLVLLVVVAFPYPGWW